MFTETPIVTTFSKLARGAPFSSSLTIYTRTNFIETVRKHFLIKIGRNKAITPDKRTVIHFLPDKIVNVCED